jgi:hypothetical protein
MHRGVGGEGERQEKQLKESKSSQRLEVEGDIVYAEIHVEKCTSELSICREWKFE